MTELLESSASTPVNPSVSNTWRKVVLIAIAACVVCLGVLFAAYYLLFPSNVFIFTDISGGRKLVLSKSGIKIDPAPDHYAANGFDHIESYISRLLEPASTPKSLMIFSPDGERGFFLMAMNDGVTAHFTLEWRKEPEREAAIRKFFNVLSIAPSEDYLAQNGMVPDSTRCLTYPVTGDAPEMTALTKRILQELCAISPNEALNIDYEER